MRQLKISWLYIDNINRLYESNETLNVVFVILQILKRYSHIINGDKLFTPKSKSYDYNDFSQRIIINQIKDKNYLNQINKFINILTNLSNNKSIEQVIHKNIRTILIKKKEEADSIKDLRPISILPDFQHGSLCQKNQQNLLLINQQNQ